MNTNQYLRWRYKQLTGTGNKYYPQELHEALQKSVRLTHIGAVNIDELKKIIKNKA